MPGAFTHLVFLVSSAGLCLTGRYTARNPIKVLNVFTLGGPMFGGRFGEAYFRIIGRIFAVFFALGVLFYAVLICIDTAHRHWF